MGKKIKEIKTREEPWKGSADIQMTTHKTSEFATNAARRIIGPTDALGFDTPVTIVGQEDTRRQRAEMHQTGNRIGQSE